MKSSKETSSLHTVQLPQGPIQYRDIGEGPTLLFIHGINVNGEMWRKVYRPLSTKFRCIVPTLPLGGHALAMNKHADLSPPSIAQIIADFIAALELKEVTAISCDTGGAFTQLALIRHPDAIERAIFTNCDAFENFLPPILRPLQACFRVPGFASLFGLLARADPVRTFMFGMLAHTPLEPELGKAYFHNFIHNPDIRRDARKVMLGISNRYTLKAAHHFRNVHKPILLVWGEDDRLFPPRYGERLANAFPNARLERVADSKTFVSEDQPEILAESIRLFVDRSCSLTV